MKSSKNSTFDIRVRAVASCLDGLPAQKAAEAYRVHRTTIHRWISDYKNADGNIGLKRKAVSGRPRKLEHVDEDSFRLLVLTPATVFGYETDLWTCNRIQQTIQKVLQTKVSRWTIWRGLKEAGLTYQKPERSYFEADEKKRQDWLKNELPKIQETTNKYKAILYFEDESNISLTAFLGKTWAPKGKTPIVKVTGNRGGISAISAISNNGNLIFNLHDKRIASDEIISFLEQILKHHKRRHIVLVMDQAPPHTSKKTKAYIDSQKRLHVFYLPPYSPDWNPDEKVWNHLKHVELKGHQVKTKKEMKNLANQKLNKMSKNQKQMKGVFFRCFVAELLH